MFSQLFGARSFAVSLRASALSIFAVSLLPTASFALDSAAQPLVSDEEEALEAETATEVEATPADVAPASFAPSEWQVARQTLGRNRRDGCLCRWGEFGGKSARSAPSRKQH